FSSHLVGQTSLLPSLSTLLRIRISLFSVFLHMTLTKFHVGQSYLHILPARLHIIQCYPHIQGSELHPLFSFLHIMLAKLHIIQAYLHFSDLRLHFFSFFYPSSSQIHTSFKVIRTLSWLAVFVF